MLPERTARDLITGGMKSVQRSAAFRCGLVVLGLLLWVWVDSHRRVSLVTCSQPGSDRFWSVRLDKGEIVWQSLESETGIPPADPLEFRFLRESPGPSFGNGYSFQWRSVQNIDFVPDASGKLQVGLRQYKTVQPYAIVPGGFALLWLAFLGWRSRQRKLAAVASGAHADDVQCGNP
jgi:hypothetical protein